jgi:hypothetical protein
MKNYHLNHYERAAGNWLRDNGINFLAVDEAKRAAFGGAKIKSFDYLISLADDEKVVAEVKGRKFKADSVRKLSAFQCWVTEDDIKGLDSWQQVFGEDYSAAFVFAYVLDNVDVELDGINAYEYEGRRYLFFLIMLKDYFQNMRTRSAKWKTVTLASKVFGKVAVCLNSIDVTNMDGALLL